MKQTVTPFAYGFATALFVCIIFIISLMAQLDRANNGLKKQQEVIHELEQENHNLFLYAIELEGHESPYGE